MPKDEKRIYDSAFGSAFASSVLKDEADTARDVIAKLARIIAVSAVAEARRLGITTDDFSVV